MPSPAPSGDEIIARLNPAIVAFLKTRIAEMGEEPSGAYNYYAVRAERGLGLSGYEQALLRHVLATRPSQVVHAGVGIGTLAAAIAAAGFHVTGYERDATRFAAAEALRDHLGLKYDLRQAFYPEGLESLEPGGLLVFTNVGAGWTLEDEARIVATFGRFDKVVLDLRLFGVFRGEEADRDALVGRLSRAGKVTALPPIEGTSYVEVAPRAARKPAARTPARRKAS